MPAVDYEALFEHSPNPYMVLDRELRYVAANRAYLRVTSSRLEDLLGRRLLDAFPNDPTNPNDESARRLEASLRRVLETGQIDTLAFIPYRVARESGGPLELRFWSATHTPLLDAEGKVRFVVQHTVDVTELAGERRGSESMAVGVLDRADVVQRSNELLRALFIQAPGFAAFLRGPSFVFELANDAYYDVVGRRDILGKPLRDALPEIEGQGFLELLARVYESGEPFVGKNAAIMLQRREGGPPEERTVDFVYQPILDAAGSVKGIFVQGHDVTEQKRLQDEREAILARERQARTEAERANRLKDDFLATVSHELRTPLNAMLGWVQLLRAGGLPPERRENALEIVARNAQAQAKLIDDLLDVSRILAGKLTLEVEDVDLRPIAEAAAESIRPAAEAKQIQLVCDLVPAVVRGDPERLQQVVWNLLSNAVKFTPRGGNVRVSVAARDRSAMIVVDDDGRGIAAEFLPHVFERFRQAEGGAARTYGGLGLGLAIVKQLVELHGGTISAASEGLGRGAAFSCELPLAAVRRRPSPEPSSESLPTADLGGMRLLVVDDEEDSRELLAAILAGSGAAVETAASAAEAFAAFRERRPDVLLSDIAMPNEDGYELIRRIRALPERDGGRTPAIALTAHARAEDRTRALLAGFRAHVPKPIEPTELIAVLASIALTR